MGRWWRWNEHLDRTKAELLISFFGHARPTSAQAPTLFVALRPVQRQGSIPIVVLFGARSFPENHSWQQMRINECGHSCRTSAKVPSAKRKGATDRRSKRHDRLAFDKEQNMNYILFMFLWEGQHDSCCRRRSRCTCIGYSVHRHDRSLGGGVVVGVMTVGISCRIARHTKLCMTRSGPSPR